MQKRWKLERRRNVSPINLFSEHASYRGTWMNDININALLDRLDLHEIMIIAGGGRTRDEFSYKFCNIFDFDSINFSVYLVKIGKIGII